MHIWSGAAQRGMRQKGELVLKGVGFKIRTYERNTVFYEHLLTSVSSCSYLRMFVCRTFVSQGTAVKIEYICIFTYIYTHIYVYICVYTIFTIYSPIYTYMHIQYIYIYTDIHWIKAAAKCINVNTYTYILIFLLL